MKRSYMDYAMSVIMGRALPDARDGLKPVHRRIIYAMYKMGNFWNKEFKKSARVVGDVIGKYHPHGDAAVYDAIVRMAQDFSLRYPLVNGQGNFGSIDGDPPAAMRYTEVRLTRLAHLLLEDIEKDTVDFVPNYDATLTEPMLLPTRIPTLLANGASGIAVGMSTNIPPHNLNELINGIKAVIRNPDLSFEELIEYIPGPDFPTAGFILGREGILSAYKTGRGIIQMRARTHIEKVKSSDRERIIVTEIPYQTNKSKIVERIAQLVQNKTIEGITDIRDETDREGIRIVIELKRGETPEVILNQLFKHTQLQTSFGIILLSVLNNQPKIFNLRQLIDLFIHFRLEVIVRRSQFELKKAKARAHILEGFKIILDHLDEAIALIRASHLPAEAKQGLMERFGLSETQAQAILDMRLQRLTGLEREKILEEYKEIIQTIARLEEILSNEGLRREIIIEELEQVEELVQEPRRTEIIDAQGEIGIEDIIAEEDMLVTISYRGYIKRVSPRLYRSQNRGGKGRIGMNIKDEDFVTQIFTAPHFRAYTHNDPVGVQIGGALKNIMAIAVGVADGLGMGTNARAALITRGLAEISRIGKKMGADPATFLGLSGIGDLVLTCTGDLSRNRNVGLKLGQGKKIEEITGEMRMVAEGVLNTKSAYRLTQKLGVRAPIISSMYRILYEGLPLEDAVRGILSTEPGEEFE